MTKLSRISHENLSEIDDGSKLWIELWNENFKTAWGRHETSVSGHQLSFFRISSFHSKSVRQSRLVMWFWESTLICQETEMKLTNQNGIIPSACKSNEKPSHSSQWLLPIPPRRQLTEKSQQNFNLPKWLILFEIPLDLWSVMECLSPWCLWPFRPRN